MSSSVSRSNFNLEDINGIFMMYYSKGSGRRSYIVATVFALLGGLVFIGGGYNVQSFIPWLLIVLAIIIAAYRFTEGDLPESVNGNGIQFLPEGLQEIRNYQVPLVQEKSPSWELGRGPAISYQGTLLSLTIQPDCSNTYKIGRATVISAGRVEWDCCDSYISADPAFAMAMSSNLGIFRSGSFKLPLYSDPDGNRLLYDLKVISGICPANLQVALIFCAKGTSVLAYSLAGGLIGAIGALVGTRLRQSDVTSQLRSGTLISQAFCKVLLSLTQRNKWKILNLEHQDSGSADT